MKPVRAIRPGVIKVPLPDTCQQTDFTCGASCFQAIAGYFGVIPTDWDEDDLRSLMGIASDVGAHPHNIMAGITYFGLRRKQIWPMTDTELFRFLDRGIPVMMMLQAWRDIDLRRKRWEGWLSEWDNGHWVAAIGYDRDGVYFEDPSLAATRGFLTHEQLFLRWHDVGPYWHRPYEKYMYQYGVAIWKAPIRKPPYYRRVAFIE